MTRPLAPIGLVASVGAELGIDYRYIHAPQRNISVARNACLDAGEAPLLAFIDDDELAPFRAGWRRWPHVSTKPARTPYWAPPERSYPPMRSCMGQSCRPPFDAPPFTETDDIRTGYTCNVLLRRSAFVGRRFDLDLGRSGGEDDVFFAGAVRDGARIAYAPDAVVDDPVPMARLTLRWLCRRSFRNGQTYARTRLAAGATRPVLLVTAAAKAVLCLAAAAITAPFRRALAANGGARHAPPGGLCDAIWVRRDLLLY